MVSKPSGFYCLDLPELERVYWRNHWKVMFRCIYKDLPLNFVVHFVVVHHVAREPSQISESLIRLTTLGDLITAKCFGVSFFHNLNPNLFFSGATRKDPIVMLRSDIVGEIIVDHNVNRLTVYVVLDRIRSRLRNSLCVENLFDAMWLFSQGTDTRKEVAVSKLSLSYIFDINFFKETKHFFAINFFWTLPYHVIFPLSINYSSSFGSLT